MTYGDGTNPIKDGLCKSCLGIKINSEQTIEIYTDILLNLGASNAPPFMVLMYAEAMLEALEKGGGYQLCTRANQSVVNTLKSMV